MPGVGLGVGGLGVSLVGYGLDAQGVDLPNGVLTAVIILGGVMFLVGIMLEVRAHRARGRSDEEGKSTFAYLRGVKGFESEGSVSDAERFIDAEDSSDVYSREDVHRPHGKPEQERRPEGGDQN